MPVVSIGGQETALLLGRGRRIAEWLSLDRRFRLKVVPPVVGPPLGITIMDLPIRVPLPAKISIQVLEPINLHERLGTSAEPEDGYELVTDAMQRSLTRLSEQRTLPVLG